MARYGSEAVARTTQFEHEYAPEQSTRTSFEVVPGGGLDADARRGVSSQFIQRVKLIAVAAALFLTLGVVRIGMHRAEKLLRPRTTRPLVCIFVVIVVAAVARMVLALKVDSAA